MQNEENTDSKISYFHDDDSGYGVLGCDTIYERGVIPHYYIVSARTLLITSLDAKLHIKFNPEVKPEVLQRCILVPLSEYSLLFSEWVHLRIGFSCVIDHLHETLYPWLLCDR